MQLVGSLAVCLLVWLCSCDAFGQFHMKRYHLQRGYSADDSSESDNSVLREYALARGCR